MTGRPVVIAIVLLVIIPFILCSPSFATPFPPDRIRVVMDDAYPPYAFRDQKGNLQGISVDLWRLWEKKTGVRVEITGDDWGRAQKRMEGGEFDCIDTIFRTPRREAIYDFTRPYATIDVPIFVHREIGGIRGVEDLAGFAIAAKEGGAVIDYIRRHVATTIIPYPSYEAMIRAAAAGQIKIFTIETPPALFYLHRFGVADRFRATSPMYSGQFHRAVRKGETALLSLIQQGFDRIGEQEREAIDRRWLGSELGGDRKVVRVLQYLLGGALLLFVLLFAWVKLLRRMVETRTRELREEIAARRRKEEELAEAHAYQRALFDLVSDAVFVHDPTTGEILDVNQQATRLFGVGRERLIGATVGIVSAGDPDLAEQKALEMIRQAAADCPRTFAWEGKNADGRVIPVEVSLTHAVVSGRDVVIASVRDTTDRLEAERERENAQRLESLGVLAGGIAHDFNNILTSISGNVSIARTMIPDDHPAKERLERAERGVERAVGLTRQLLTFAKGGSPERKPVDTASIVAESVSLALHGSNVTPRISLDPALAPIVGDAGQISQCLNNLLINARQAMPNGGEVEVEARPLERDGKRFVEIVVRDQGLGIPPDIIDRIFDPYFTTKKTGSGLGLATVYSIVRRHGGEISVQSTEGEGSSFRLLLPAAGESDGESPRGRVEIPPLPGRVLVMDDDPAILQVAAEILRSAGCRVETATDGGEAFERYRGGLESGEPFDLVILDLTVRGGVGGRETCSMIREVDQDACIVVSSGYSDDPVLTEPERYGFDGVIRKPFGRDGMLEAVGRIMRRCQDGDAA